MKAEVLAGMVAANDQAAALMTLRCQAAMHIHRELFVRYCERATGTEVVDGLDKDAIADVAVEYADALIKAILAPRPSAI